jgi:hypothetical protein
MAELYHFIAKKSSIYLDFFSDLPLSSEGVFFPGMVKQMDRKSNTVLTLAQAERTKELSGVLTAIGVVSRRLAKKLALLEG